jgi:hypothetical protein
VRRLGIEALIAAKKSGPRVLVLAMIIARILAPQSPRATARGLGPDPASTSLGALLHVEAADAEALYRAMAWRLGRPPRIAAALAARPLADGTLVLCDLTATYCDGRSWPLAQFGHRRDGTKGKVQIVVGLVWNVAGCPGAIEVLPGHPGAPTTLAPQLQKLREQFHRRQCVLGGDRGLLTHARMRAELQPVPGLDWGSARRRRAIQQLVEAGAPDLPCLAEPDGLACTAPPSPQARLSACRTPLLALERARQREALRQAPARELDALVQATTRPPRRLTGQAAMAVRGEKVRKRFKMGKHFQSALTDTQRRYPRDPPRLAAEAALDGVYGVRTRVSGETLSPERTVGASKSLAAVERALRSLKTVDLYVRPMGHRLAERVRAHVFLCMLAYDVAWHMRQALAPLLCEDDDQAAGEARRASVVAPAQRSPRAQRKTRTPRTDEGLPIHSFQTLLDDVATVTQKRIRFGARRTETTMLTTPTPLQLRALDL